MRLDRALSVLAVLISATALVITLKQASRDPLGTDLSKYDLSSPEKALQSLNTMATRRDLRAAWQLLALVLESESSPETKLYFSESPEIKVLKSVEVSESAGPRNKGLIVSFVKVRASGVDYHTVVYFRRDEAGRFRLAEPFYVPYGTEASEVDKALQRTIDEFKKSGKV